jgi:hypothetical protein
METGGDAEAQRSRIHAANWKKKLREKLGCEPDTATVLRDFS